MAEVPSGKVATTEYKPHSSGKQMKAAQWTGKKSITLGTVPRPAITAPADAIVRITHCTICGSDLHMYAGDLNAAMQKGDIMGHEAIGIIDEVGPKVKDLSPGDRVIILPVIACGDCEYCKRKEFSLCDRKNPSKEMEGMYGHRLAGIFGYSHLTGGYPGDQAEYCRVPNADLVCVKAPHDVDAKKLVGLADVTTTAWHGCELAEVDEGDVDIRGAKKVYIVDVDPQRLELAKTFGLEPVDVNKHKDVADYILSVQPGGLDRAIEASGFRSAASVKHRFLRDTMLERDSGDTIAAVIKATRKCGNVALIGDFFFETHSFPIGMLMEKTITLRGGQLMAQRYHPFLLDLVVQGKYDPSWMFTYEDEFENVSECYAKFHEHKIPGGLKVLLTTEFGRQK
ncbi:hypothetical protein Daus18300_003975 [Diaporthe australafricana]|uniref:Alcohol dehydrogenase-like N-terminal domain-containing protein n=1 Tax=Diaporthe australafricana TaxID=127596 RepID=A0ABR3XB09_9PEZI